MNPFQGLAGGSIPPRRIFCYLWFLKYCKWIDIRLWHDNPYVAINHYYDVVIEDSIKIKNKKTLNQKNKYICYFFERQILSGIEECKWKKAFAYVHFYKFYYWYMYFCVLFCLMVMLWRCLNYVVLWTSSNETKCWQKKKNVLKSFIISLLLS